MDVLDRFESMLRDLRWLMSVRRCALGCPGSVRRSAFVEVEIEWIDEAADSIPVLEVMPC